MQNGQHGSNLGRFDLIEQEIELGRPFLPVVELDAGTDAVCFPTDLFAFGEDLFVGGDKEEDDNGGEQVFASIATCSICRIHIFIVSSTITRVSLFDPIET